MASMEIHNDEHSMVRLVQERVARQRKTTTVPADSFSPEIAKSLAEALDVFVYRKGENYVFALKKGVGPYMYSHIQETML